MIMSHVISFFIGVCSSIVAAIIVWMVAGKHSRHFSFQRVFKDIMTLWKMIQADNFSPDYVVGVDRNGCIVASILSGYLGVTTIIAAGTESVRHNDGSRDVLLSKVHLPQSGVLSGKKLLIVCCFVDTGSAMRIIYDYYTSLPDRPSEIRTAALYTTVSPRFKPRYYVCEIGKDIKLSIEQMIQRMPWMNSNWKYLLDRNVLNRRA
jgi:hypoxanthine phosphoribosyltransferase